MPLAESCSPSKLHSNLAFGLPILYIGPAGSNVGEAISRFGCGASIRVGDSNAIVSFIRKLCADNGFRSDLSRRARQAFEQAYCDQQTLPMFDQVVERTMNGRSALSDAGSAVFRV